jgi:hypothetical protein
MNKLRFSAALLACLGLLAFCSGGPQQTRAYQVRIESAGELLTGQASACLSQIRAYWAVAEYAKAAEMDFESAAKEMNTGQTRENLRTMGEMKARLDRVLSAVVVK